MFVRRNFLRTHHCINQKTPCRFSSRKKSVVCSRSAHSETYCLLNSTESFLVARDACPSKFLGQWGLVENCFYLRLESNTNASCILERWGDRLISLIIKILFYVGLINFEFIHIIHKHSLSFLGFALFITLDYFLATFPRFFRFLFKRRALFLVGIFMVNIKHLNFLLELLDVVLRQWSQNFLYQFTNTAI